ncbi:uncharacterized protein LOC143574379 [Bidens hawaiensis]|uniref:uncharacterized protein LOC143574379 n=1 Tax=Bidens hawaiensis TaxID=980011 RepID=UPI00404B0BD9
MDAHESDRASPSKHSESNDGTNRHGKSKSSWGLSTAFHAVHGVGFVAKKVVSNRLTDSLWHSKKTSSTASGPSDETVNHHTSQPLLNVEDEQTPVSTNKPTQETENINVNDQLEESLKPQNGSDAVDGSGGWPVKPVNQRRRPSSNTFGSNVSDRLGNLKSSARRLSTTSSNTVNQSENLEPSDGSHVKPVNKHLWPGTIGSTVLNKTIHFPYIASMTPNLKKPSFPSNNSKHLPESSSDVTNQPSLESQPSSPNTSHILASRGVSPISVNRVGPSLASLAPTKGVKTSIARGVSPTPARGISPAPARGVSPAPARGVSPAPARGVSPTPTRGVDPDVSPTSVKPYKSSGRRHFFNANILSVFTKIVDNRKEKNMTDEKEVAQYLEVLYNIQVQWQFANASAEAALDLQRATAERSLFDMWRTILDLRDSLASKKIDVDLLLMQLKLYAVLYRQMGFIDEWATIQKEHESALFATTNDLQARSLSVPITGGAKVCYYLKVYFGHFTHRVTINLYNSQADIKGLKLIVFSTIQVLQSTVSCIHSTVSKVSDLNTLHKYLSITLFYNS